MAGWVASATAAMTGITSNGTITSQPPISATTASVMTMNGTSTSVVIVAEAKKSRKVSISRTSPAIPPVERRPRSSRIARICLKTSSPTSASTRAPATSTK